MANGPEFPPFAVLYSRNARAVRAGLPAETQARVIEIVDQLAENPNQRPDRLVQLAADLYIYRHPNPLIEITFKLDRDKQVLSLLHLVAPTLQVAKTLFISYSHLDQQWLMELKKWLKPLEQNDLIAVWDDQKLTAGDDWRREIEESLQDAKAAVLLVSQNFLASEFIAGNELPQLLDAAQERGLVILWIAVSSSTVEDTGIFRYQAAHIDPPLDTVSPAEQNKYFKAIYQAIKKAVSA